MSSIEIVKIALVSCWVLLGVGLVLFIWKRQAKVAETKESKTSQANNEKLEQLYNYLVQHPEGVTMRDITGLLLVDENQASQYLGQLEALGIVGQTSGPNGQSSFTLNKDSEFNLF